MWKNPWREKTQGERKTGEPDKSASRVEGENGQVMRKGKKKKRKEGSPNAKAQNLSDK